jgi:dTDP-4-amino-4,6-dideoxygalactose transaminase
MVLELESKISDFLETSLPLFVSNGTIALQLAIKAF